MITFGSVCSGIESASVALEPMGFVPSWFSEIEPFPSAVLAHHWPHVQNYGDMLNIRHMIDHGLIDAPDVFIGGTPCQAFSVAGNRESLDDDRGQLSLEFIKIADSIDEQRKRDGKGGGVVWWENVPGVLNTKDNAFGCFLGALAGEDEALVPAGKKWTNAGYVLGPKRAVAWRVIDAQYFGVAQRRRRVFVVASARDGFDPRKVLFESEGVRRDTPPSRETREEVTDTVTAGARKQDNNGGRGLVVTPYTVSSFAKYVEGVGTLKASGGDLGGGSETIAVSSVGDPTLMATLCASDDEKWGSDQWVKEGKAVLVAHGTQDPCTADNLAFTLGTNNGAENAVYPIHDKTTRHAGKTGVGSGNGLGVGKNGDPCPTLTTGDSHSVCYSFKPGQGAKAGGIGYAEDISPTLTATDSGTQRSPGLLNGGVVRRLTPVECERLQGFPDDHTKIPWSMIKASYKENFSYEKYLISSGKTLKDSVDECPDGPRYKAIGNSKAVPCVRWIGARILVEWFA